MAAQDTPDEMTEAGLRVGRTLRDKWHLDALIDVGGMAAVYAATHRNGMRGAVKILHRHRSLDPDIAGRFRREGYIANKVAHPNAVRVLDDDIDDDGSVFLVMELLEGSTLRDRACAHGGTLPPDTVLLLVDQLLDVLAVAHDAAIIHRDVKPDNVLVTDGGQVKILDFGIARISEPRTLDHSETRAGLPLGSPAFMSPEQARGRWDLVDAQSDVWSVGATMFLLLTGQDVHTADTVPELLAEIFTKPARSLATGLPDAHPALVDVVDRALKLRLADRWQDARAMQAAARKAYVEIYGAALPATTPGPSASTKGPSPYETPCEPSVPPRNAITVRASTARWRSYLRPAALALVGLLAAVLGVAGAARDSSSREPARNESLPVHTLASSAPSLMKMQTEAPLPVADAIAAPTSPPPRPASLAAPTPRSRLPAVYDRRH